MGIAISCPASAAEFELAAAVNNVVSPRMPVTAEQMAHAVSSSPESRLFLARLDGGAAGTGYVSPSSAGPEAMYGMARVDPDLRGRGVGGGLYSAISAHARSLGRQWLWGRVGDDDAESLAIVLAHGFEETGREPMVGVNPQHAPAPGPRPEGVEIVSLAERPDLARAAWEVEREAIEDVPGPHPMTSQPFERWLAGNVDSPAALPQGSFLALADGEVVGHAGLTDLPARPRAAENAFTGVRRAWRGRGIATALKQAQIAWAREAGYEWIQTTNDEPNATMRDVNARLGYEPVAGFVFVRGPLSSARTAAAPV